MQENRPDPNRILQAVQTAENKNKGGHLYVFLGMCPGVGKTYAMLQTAHEKKKEDGVDIVVGVVETHGRKETAALLDGLEVIPAKKIPYKGKLFNEMDLEAILERRPQVVLVDELAHTNMLSSRHKKRWQDVEELLSNGIDVYTTINVQHVESLKEDVALITGISVRETVPDAIFERANQIKLIDLPAEQLLERLLDGKVYLPQNSVVAAENFFRTDKLTALRELSLRFAGDVVGGELEALQSGIAPAGHKEKFLILIYSDAATKKVIRAARKAALASNAELYGLLMDKNGLLSDREKESLLTNEELFRNMNGELITRVDADRFSAIQSVINKYGITRVLLRKSQSSLWRDLFLGGSLVTRLLKETKVDVQLLHQMGWMGVEEKNSFWRTFYLETNPSKYYRILLLLALVTIFNIVLAHYTGYFAVGFVYLLLVLFVGVFSSIVPIMFCALASALAWNFFFIPPLFTFKINKAEDWIMSVVYLFTAIVVSVLIHRIQTSRRLLRAREERNAALLKIARILSAALEIKPALQDILSQLKYLFKGEFAVVYQIIPEKLETVNSHPMGYAWTENPKEKSVGFWCMKNNLEAGWGTATLSSSEALYIPLSAAEEVVGFLSYLPQNYAQSLSAEDRNLLASVAGQIASFLLRERLKKKTEEMKRLEETQKIYNLVLNTVSHELKTPITVIKGALAVLKTGKGKNADSLDDLEGAVLNLTYEINNILDISKVSVGSEIKREWTDLQDIVYSVKDKLSLYAAKHKLVTSFQKDLPFVRINFALVESALSNLIVNAVNYTPTGGHIWVKCYVENQCVVLETCDEGPGLDDEEKKLIFNKFYRAKSTSSQKSGSGLGLFIVKSVALLHGGDAVAQDNPSGGLKIKMLFPLELQPKI
ncbi:ATP-binding protein [Candidatus Proelusimicrobium volucris]|uniref:ATP-binding protein n=1 Tax=Candidatus Proelusimicrobium volucris TaxID=3416225 RepID=UPI003D11BB95